MEDGLYISKIIIFIILLVVNGVFSGNEAAIDMLNESKIEKKANKGDKKSKRLFNIMNAEARFFSTVEVIVTSIALATGAFLGRTLFESLIAWILLILSVVVPKRAALQNPEKWAYITVNIVTFFIFLLNPVIKLITIIAHLLLRLIGIDPNAVVESVTEEEIISMVSEGHEQGVLEESEAEMITNIFELGDTSVADIMTHRKNITSIDVEQSLTDAANDMLNDKFSRYPVYEGDIDNIVGILHLKEVMRVVMNQNSNKTIRDVMREPYFVPETQNIDILFKEMQVKKVHMAVVIDEYGQTGGIVAMEDIIEEIVGNILDEYDVDENYIQEIAEGMYVMKGMTPLDSVEDVLDIDFDEEDFDTLNGLLVSKLERIPLQGESTVIRILGYDFEVLLVENNMITHVKVYPANEENEQESELK